MIVSVKDTLKLISISIVICCAAFVCTLFLNYNIDIVGAKDQIATESGEILYEAVISSGKVTCIVTGGCLIATSLVLLIFYIKNHIDTHGKELGILKALGYSDFSIASNFWIFGATVFIGSFIGFIAAFAYMPSFYELQNSDGLLPDIEVCFHPSLLIYIIALPTLFFILFSIGYAKKRLKSPTLELLKEVKYEKIRKRKSDYSNITFLHSMKKSILRDRKILVFFIIFSAFCFSAMTQMSSSMSELSSETMGLMILSIGLILAFLTLFLSLSTVVKSNTKTIAMMRVLGYSRKECSKTVLNGYRPFSYIGFAVGSVYQYLLLKIMVDIVFANVENIPEYSFDISAFIVSLAVFTVTYETFIFIYSKKINNISLKSIMTE